MAFDAFLKIDGVDGEATRKGFEKQMEIQSFNWGASNPATIGAGGGGGGGGKVSLSTFNLTKKSDSASPLLFQSCCDGSHYAKAVVTLNKAGGKWQSTSLGMNSKGCTSKACSGPVRPAATIRLWRVCRLPSGR
jgi:type VI secretion system secreted protein Hcp